jgi:hypothetical protein
VSSFPGASDTPLSPELEARLQSELQPGERLVWAGQPRADLAARPAWFMVPCRVFFTGFSLFWIVGAGGMAALAGGVNGGFGSLFGCFPCFGIPFVLIGLFMVASPIWLRRQAHKTLYALTDRRAIVFEPTWFRTVTVRSYTAAGLSHLSRRERPDGSGDLVFEEFTTSSLDSDGNRSYSTTRRGFLAIDRVREVEDLVRKTLLAHQG